MQQKYFLITVILWLPLFINAQTCIIAKKTKEAIYVGADSRLTSTRKIISTGKIITDTSSICKIYTHGKFNFAIEGAFLNEAIIEANNACLKGKSFPDVIKIYFDSFGKKLMKLVDYIKKSDSSTFRERIANGWFSQIIFFGEDSDSLHLSLLFFTYNEISSNSFRIDCKVSTGKNDILMAGHIHEIKDIIYKPETWASGEIKTINSLIQIESKYHPMEVGGYIDIIKYTKKNGGVWIQRKKQCN